MTRNSLLKSISLTEPSLVHGFTYGDDTKWHPCVLDASAQKSKATQRQRSNDQTLQEDKTASICSAHCKPRSRSHTHNTRPFLLCHSSQPVCFLWVFFFSFCNIRGNLQQDRRNIVKEFYLFFSPFMRRFVPMRNARTFTLCTGIRPLCRDRASRRDWARPPRKGGRKPPSCSSIRTF